MNIKDIEKIIQMLEGTDINEIVIEHEGVKLQLKRGLQKEISIIQASSNASTVPTPVVLPSQAVDTKLINPTIPSVETTDQKPPADEYEEIAAPMVGTFYRAPSPESDPYVKIGDMVDKDDVVCIIETMKVMNEIQAETQGKIVKILIEKGKPVEFGQPLFLLEKI